MGEERERGREGEEKGGEKKGRGSIQTILWNKYYKKNEIINTPF